MLLRFGWQSSSLTGTNSTHIQNHVYIYLKWLNRPTKTHYHLMPSSYHKKIWQTHTRMWESMTCRVRCCLPLEKPMLVGWKNVACHCSWPLVAATTAAHCWLLPLAVVATHCWRPSVSDMRTSSERNLKIHWKHYKSSPPNNKKKSTRGLFTKIQTKAPRTITNKITT